jgi:hypothetical protein
MRIAARRLYAVITRASNRLRSGLALAQLLPTYVLFGVLKHIVPLRWLVRRAWCPPTGARDRARERRLAMRVLRLSQRMGLPDRDCLQRSLLLYRVLSRAGADPKLVVGFQRVNSRVLGHAWVTVDGRPVFEPEADLLRFMPALTFGVHGTLLPELPGCCAA